MRIFAYIVFVCLFAFDVLAQEAYELYAEDVLHAEETAEREQNAGCKKLDIRDSKTLTTAEAQTLLCIAVKQLPLALATPQYGANDRSELLIGAFLTSGVNFDAIGRVASFYDAKRNEGGKDTFKIADRSHDKAFNRHWQITFGRAYARKIYLQQAGNEIVLDVDGTVQWQLGHTAPTVWVKDAHQSNPQLRVMDPILSPDQLLTIDQWRQLHNAESAAILWGRAGEAPVIMVEHLPPAMQKQLKLRFNVASAEQIDTDTINALLRKSSPEIRMQIHGDILNIEEKSSWYPRHWTGYSFTGDLENLNGNPLPQWRANRPDITQLRIEAALQNLEMLNAYAQLRAAYSSDEEMLQQVKQKMLAKNKNPGKVLISFDE
ncbi:MAG: hypothetical protein MK052_09690 [Alphaproteobacteria bacterium]|nr:hypothetical protein [Alphaproteobacteria bacterium]